jgi:uncharacterized membrane protein YjdF
MALTGRDDVARGYWRVVGWFVVNALLFDLIGQLGDLWEVPIAGSFTYDNLVHATSMPFAICAIVWATAMTLQRRYRLQHVPGFVPMFVVMGALSLSVMHELVELTIDVVTGSQAGTGIVPGDLYDTHLDLFYDSLGIALFVIGLVARNAFTARARRSAEIAA